jgi:predicted class III extradiol MEMO1 family dioxygenase
VDGDREGYVEDDDEEYNGLEQKDLSERFEIFAKYHNSIVGHFGIGNTLKAMSLGGNNGRACEKMSPSGSKSAKFVRKPSGEKVQSGRTK